MTEILTQWSLIMPCIDGLNVATAPRGTSEQARLQGPQGCKQRRGPVVVRRGSFYRRHKRANSEKQSADAALVCEGKAGRHPCTVAATQRRGMLRRNDVKYS